jgi:formylglycine-generating enzyme required for sulfatase activity
MIRRGITHAVPFLLLAVISACRPGGASHTEQPARILAQAPGSTVAGSSARLEEKIGPADQPSVARPSASAGGMKAAEGEPSPTIDAAPSATTPCSPVDLTGIDAPKERPEADAPPPATDPTKTPAVVQGDTRSRSADGMMAVYVAGGEFVMGSSDHEVDLARALCVQYSRDPNTARAACQRTAFENEQPSRRVRLAGFWIDRTEVTVGQYRRCVDDGACTPPVRLDSATRDTYFDDPGYRDYPVVWVDQGQATSYCAWAGGRLPTESEWEYAARGPDSLLFPWGDVFDGSRLNYCDASCTAGPNDPSVDDGYPNTAPAGSFPAGASWWGALDLAGNVREWVADWYGLYPIGPQTNPTGPPVGDARIPRGGSWLDTPDDVRSTNRGANAVDYARHKVGFRCAADG